MQNDDGGFLELVAIGGARCVFLSCYSSENWAVESVDVFANIWGGMGQITS